MILAIIQVPTVLMTDPVAWTNQGLFAAKKVADRLQGATGLRIRSSKRSLQPKTTHSSQPRAWLELPLARGACPNILAYILTKIILRSL